MADAKPPKIQFGKPEKTNWLGLIAFWVIFLSLGGVIWWMLATNPAQHRLTCRSTGVPSSLLSFGTCTDD